MVGKPCKDPMWQITTYLPVCVQHTFEGVDEGAACVFCERDEARAALKRLQAEHEVLYKTLREAQRSLDDVRTVVTRVALRLS
jgi:hypothetical protein